jgi:hypothetical protein
MTAVRAIETEQYRLVMYVLESGEQYFMQSDDEAPVTLRTVSAGEVTLHPYSTISAYSDVDTPLVFLNKNGLTIVKTTPKVYLLKTVIEEELPTHPLPLVVDSNSTAIQQFSDQIRLIASQKRLSALNDFPGVLRALNKAVEDTTQQADSAIRLADDSIGLLLDNIQAVESSDPFYSEIRKTTIEQMRLKLKSYNHLMSLIDTLLSQKEDIEGLTHDLQKQIKPITTIAEALPYIS